MTADSVYIGGLGRLQQVRSLIDGEGGTGGATRLHAPSDLQFWRGEHSKSDSTVVLLDRLFVGLLYPTVSLFNLEADPQVGNDLVKLPGHSLYSPGGDKLGFSTSQPC